MTLDTTPIEHDAHVEAPETASEPAHPKKTRETKSTIHGTVLTVTDASGTHSYETALLPDTMHVYLAIVGLRFVLATAEDPAARWAEIQAGTYTGRKPAAVKAPKPPPPLRQRRQAIANAIVAATKKTAAPLTQQQAEDKARMMNAAEVDELMEDEGVVRQLAKITGKSGLLAKKLSPSEPALAMAAE